MDLQRFLQFINQPNANSHPFTHEEINYFLREKNNYGMTVAHYIAHNMDEQTVCNFFNFIKKHVPGILAEVLLTTAHDKRSMFHYLAQYQSAATLAFSLGFVAEHDSLLLYHILSAKSANDWRLEHLIARFQQFASLQLFFKLITEHIPGDQLSFIRNKTTDNWEMGHFIARFQAGQTVVCFLNKMLKEGEDNLPDLLLAKTKQGWNFGHIVAEYHSKEVLIFYFYIILKHVPDVFPALIKATTADGWHIGHLIVHHQDPAALSLFLDLVIKHAPESLAILVSAKNDNSHTMIDQIITGHNGSLGGIIYQLVKSDISLESHTLLSIKGHEQAVLNHVAQLPLAIQINVLHDILNKNSALGLYLGSHPRFLHPGLNSNNAWYPKVKAMMQEAQDIDIFEVPATPVSIVSSSLFKKTAKLARADDPQTTFNFNATMG